MPLIASDITDVIAGLRDHQITWSQISPAQRGIIWDMAVVSGHDPTEGMLNMTNVFLDRLSRKIQQLTDAIEKALSKGG